MSIQMLCRHPALCATAGHHVAACLPAKFAWVAAAIMKAIPSADIRVGYPQNYGWDLGLAVAVPNWKAPKMRHAIRLQWADETGSFEIPEDSLALKSFIAHVERGIAA